MSDSDVPQVDIDLTVPVSGQMDRWVQMGCPAVSSEDLRRLDPDQHLGETWESRLLDGFEKNPRAKHGNGPSPDRRLHVR